MLTRTCAYCGLPLTDSASLQAGVGPVCRGKDNALYAKGIPADLPAAKAAFQAVVRLISDSGAEVSSYFHSTALPAFEAAMESETPDFRDAVRALVWIASGSKALRAKVGPVVSALGYPAVAAMILGMAVSSPATLALIPSPFKNRPETLGILNLVGASAPKATKPLRAFGGVKTTTGWCFPLANLDTLVQNLPHLYPWLTVEHPEGWSGLALARENALAAFKASQTPAVTVTTVVTPAPTPAKAPSPVTVTPVGGRPAAKNGTPRAGIRTPYNGGWIVTLKTLVPATNRSYSAADQTWEVDADFLPLVLAELPKFFPSAKV
jgi:hypothetical protein